MVGAILGGLCISCTDRAVNSTANVAAAAPFYALIAPWYLAGIVTDSAREESFRRQLERDRADPEHIPTAVAQALAARTEITAETLEQLFEVTGLSPYRRHVPLVSFGTLEQDLWIYYRKDAALNARFDPVSRKIIGPVRNYQAAAPSRPPTSP